MAVIKPADFDIHRTIGDSFQIVVTVRDSAGALVDVTGARAIYKAATLATAITKDSNVGSAEIALGGTAGTVTIKGLSADTTGKTAGTVTHECRLKLSSGAVHTLFSGDFTLVTGTAATPT